MVPIAWDHGRGNPNLAKIIMIMTKKTMSSGRGADMIVKVKVKAMITTMRVHNHPDPMVMMKTKNHLEKT